MAFVLLPFNTCMCIWRSWEPLGWSVGLSGGWGELLESEADRRGADASQTLVMCDFLHPVLPKILCQLNDGSENLTPPPIW